MTFSQADTIFMRRALQLASSCSIDVKPNPKVGCVIVHHDEIIGEGYTSRYGGSHAEVNAINSVADKNLLSQSTVYVSLEPCAHYGKTPPCANLLIKHNIKKVIICNLDPFPLVNGGGVTLLEQAGIECLHGLLHDEGRWINRRFFTTIEKKRPYILLKWAETADGFVARENYDSKWISGEFSRKKVHQWRSEEDAIMVGTNTARYDNPSLTTRDWAGKNPIRVVIDKALTLDKSLHLFDRSTPTLCYNSVRDAEEKHCTWIKLTEETFISSLLRDLNERNIQSLIVEGGSALLQSFIDSGLWDEARIFVSSETFGKGIESPKIRGKVIRNEDTGNDKLTFLINK